MATLNKTQIDKILSEGKAKSFDLKYRDVLYCLMLRNLSDIGLAYQGLYGKEVDNNVISMYNELDSIVWLKERIGKALSVQDATLSDVETIISNEENLAGLNDILKKLDKWLKDEAISPKEYAQQSGMIRGKIASLNGNKVRIDEQYIHVYSKFNTICHNCHKEYERDTKKEDYAVCPHCHTHYDATKDNE